MATINITVTGAWTKLADDSDDPVLVTSKSPAMFEFATSATATAPTVTGHRLTGMHEGAAMTRMVIGDGYLYCRITDARFTAAVMEVSK